MSGQLQAIGFGYGVQSHDAVTTIAGSHAPVGVYQQASDVNTPVSNVPSRNDVMGYAYTAVLLVLILAFAHWVSEHESSELKPGHIKIGFWNLFWGTIMFGTGIAGAKIVANKYLANGPFKPAVDIINLW